MDSAQFSPQLHTPQLSPQRLRRFEAAKRLRLRVLLVGLTTAAVAAFPIGVAGAWLATEVFEAVQPVRRAGQAVDLPKLMAERPGLLASAGLLAVVGLAAGAAGAAAVVVTVGPERRPPPRVLALAGGPVIFFATLGVGMTFAQLGWPGGLLPSAVGVGLASWLFGPVLTIWCAALLSIAANHHREQAIPLEGEAPEEVEAFFDSVGAELEPAGFEFVRDEEYLNAPGRYRRLWIGAEGTIFASALYRPTADSILQATSAYSVLEGGDYVEATNASLSLRVPEEMQRNVAVDDAWAPGEVVARQLELLRDARSRGAEPARLTAEDDAAVQEFGLWWFGRQMLKSRKGRATAELLWLADPYWAEEAAAPTSHRSPRSELELAAV